jgi:hypothetical protein
VSKALDVVGKRGESKNDIVTMLLNRYNQEDTTYPAIIIKKVDKNPRFFDDFWALVKDYDPQNVDKMVVKTREIGEIMVIFVQNSFKNYRIFDDFLLNLVQKCGLFGLENGGLLLGHLDLNSRPIEILSDYYDTNMALLKLKQEKKK